MEDDMCFSVTALSAVWLRMLLINAYDLSMQPGIFIRIRQMVEALAGRYHSSLSTVNAFVLLSDLIKVTMGLQVDRWLPQQPP
jgi:hypothetical protein